MFRSLRRLGTAVMASLIALASCGAPALATQQAVVMGSAHVSRYDKRFLLNDAAPFRLYGRKGSGIRMAQQQRSAAKKRSVARNRRLHR